MNLPLVVWTRSADHWAQDELLIGQRFPCQSLPLTQTETVFIQDIPDLHGPMIISSPQTIDHLLKQSSDVFNKIKQHPVFTFGDKTATVLKNHGFSVFHHHQCQSLAELYQVVLKASPQTIVYVGAETSAYNPRDLLAQKNVQFHHWAVYQTITTQPREALAALLQKHRKILFCLASPKAASTLFNNLEKGCYNQIEVACIGQTTAREVLRFTSSYIMSQHQTIDSLAERALEWYNFTKE